MPDNIDYTHLNFSHLVPNDWLDLLQWQSVSLVLAHLVDKDDYYAEWYKANKDLRPAQRAYIMDNGGYEFFNQGKENPYLQGNKLVELGKKISANYIVLPDYPNRPVGETIQSALKFAPQFHDAGFGAFFVPQSLSGDIEGLIRSFAWAASHPLIDYIGLSIIAVPNAYNCLRSPHQRFISRWRLMNELQKRGLLDLAYSNHKKIHMLGLLDGPYEIMLLKDFDIDSWDSSQAAQAAICNLEFSEKAATGLPDMFFTLGKDQLGPVDFSYNIKDDKGHMALTDRINKNMKFIDDLVDRFNEEEV